MKYLVMEVHPAYAVVLDEEGRFLKTEDFLLENNRAFSAFLKAQGVPHIYEEGPGMHDMKFWSAYVEKIIPWMFG